MISYLGKHLYQITCLRIASFKKVNFTNIFYIIIITYNFNSREVDITWKLDALDIERSKLYSSVSVDGETITLDATVYTTSNNYIRQVCFYVFFFQKYIPISKFIAIRGFIYIII